MHIVQVYPIVSAVWGHCEITMKYLGGLDREFTTYRVTIRIMWSHILPFFLMLSHKLLQLENHRIYLSIYKLENNRIYPVILKL